MDRAISGTELKINNETISYEPNTLVYGSGKGDRKVSPQVDGGGRVSHVFSNDISTAFGMVKFSLRVTVNNRRKYETLHTNEEKNVIKLTMPDGTPEIFEEMAIVNQPEFDAGVDGLIELEFNGSQSALG